MCLSEENRITDVSLSMVRNFTKLHVTSWCRNVLTCKLLVYFKIYINPMAEMITINKCAHFLVTTCLHISPFDEICNILETIL